MVNNNFEVTKKSIGELFFEPQIIFKIPRFQRQYSWEEKNIEEFWNTLHSNDSVFLGTLILNTKNAITKKFVEIIDGQQRYLTIQIFAAVIRNICLELAKSKNDKKFLQVAKGIQKTLIGKEDRYDEEKYTNYLITGESISKFFRIYIQDFEREVINSSTPVKKNSESDRVKKAYIKFSELINHDLSKKNNESKIQYLKDLIEVRLNKQYFAEIKISSDDLAYEIFETVNATGVDLSVSDLIKNQIFKNIIGNDDVYLDSAQAKWKDFTERVQTSGFTLKDYLNYYWSSKYGYVPDKKLYRVIRSKFTNKKSWEQFLNDLNRNSMYLNLIMNGSIDDLEIFFKSKREALKAYQCLRVLRNIKAKTWVILMLCLFRNIDKKESNYARIPFKIDNKWIIFEKFTFLYFQILNMPGNWYFKEVWNFCKKIEKLIEENKSIKYFTFEFNTLLTSFFSKLPKEFDINFSESFNLIEYKSDQKSRIIIRYILNEIEKYLGGSDDEGYDENKVNIEHILPQNPTQWKLTKKEISQIVNKIGNLTLLGITLNGKAGNISLKDKLLVFKKSKLNLVRDLYNKIKTSEFDFQDIMKNKNFNAIKNRSEYLTTIAYEIWVKDLKKRIGRQN